MKRLKRISMIAIGLLALQLGAAQSKRPENATGLCRDGSYTVKPNKISACRGHKGVKEWYAGPAKGEAAPKVPPPIPASPSSTTQARTQSQAAALAAAKANAKPNSDVDKELSKETGKQGGSQALPPQAPGGGSGMVWFNSSSKVYHCEGDRYYGRTKHGEYMTEAQAKAQGGHGARGGSCQK